MGILFKYDPTLTDAWSAFGPSTHVIRWNLDDGLPELVVLEELIHALQHNNGWLNEGYCYSSVFK